MNSTKNRLIDAGLRMLLEKGYNGLGIQAVLEATGSPKGSFYHHFTDKEDFALKVVDAYILDVHALLGRCARGAVKLEASFMRSRHRSRERRYSMMGRPAATSNRPVALRAPVRLPEPGLRDLQPPVPFSEPAVRLRQPLVSSL